MNPSRRALAVTALLLACSCASTGKDTPPGSGGGPGGGGSGSASGGSGGPSGSFFNEGGSGNGGPPVQVGDAGVLADNGSGTCVAGRTCDPTCDELVESGKHEYVEPAPDDGSALPPANVASMFNGAGSMSGGPCIVEPPDGSLFPNNWVRPRIRFNPGSGQTIFRITIHAVRQKNDLVVYTRSKTWKIPKDIWTALTKSTWGEDVTVTVSSIAAGGGAPVSSQVTFQIAPANANGSLVYWAAVGKNAGQSWLESFGVGDENVATALTVPQTQWSTARSESGQIQTRGATPGAASCMGCHVAVPDKQSVVFNENWPWDGVGAMVDPGDTGKVPAWLTPGGRDALGMPWLGMMSFSTHVWNDMKQHLMVAAFQGESKFPTTWPTGMFSDGGGPKGVAPWGYQGANEWDVSPASQLVWMDLSTSVPSVVPASGTVSGDQMSLAMAANEGTSWGFLARTGDPSGAASPTWAHSGMTIVYTSTNASQSGRMNQGTADLWSIPFNDKMGGTATPISGASDPNFNEYYPAFSPDDQLVAFDRTPVADNMYYDPNAQVYVVPATGGTPTRLAANDPPACTGVRSPGATNSWPKWSPEYPECGGKTYYWLVFSSSRDQVPFGMQNEPTSQLYLTALVVDQEALKSYPGIYVWNQHTTATVTPYVGQTQSNHTPQWEPIDLPVPPPPPPPPPPPT
ncbi:MAG TPA: hypothetical protein VKU41_33070 [Polyangiaceae bacterium]|nr:hypothetical protein [Polyangiaceae bacterium]